MAVLDLPGFTKIEVKGAGAFAFLDKLLCTKIPKVGRISLVYALLPDGKVLSEFTVVRVAQDEFYLVGAASSEWHDLDVLEMALPNDGSVTLKNVTADYGSLIVVGPRSRDVLAQVTTSALDNESFPWLSMRMIDTKFGPVRALRVNYVGELGWELHASNEQMVALYDAIWKAGEKHAIADMGIYAVDSLRLDKCYRGWKGDLEIGFSPFDASLDRFVDLNKPSFVGRDALVAEKAAGPKYRFVPMILDQDGDADAPFCSSVFSGDKRVGIVTSGGWSFTLDKSIALAYVRPEFEASGTKLEIEIFGERKPATVGQEPLFDPRNERLRA
ncbi:MAG: aminomethyltransferase family protein [Actinomycetota bacterium]